MIGLAVGLSVVMRQSSNTISTEFDSEGGYP